MYVYFHSHKSKRKKDYAPSLMYLKAYDSHCNLVLGEVEETIYIVEEDDEEEEIVKVCSPCHFETHANQWFTDDQEAIRDAVCPRYVP